MAWPNELIVFEGTPAYLVAARSTLTGERLGGVLWEGTGALGRQVAPAAAPAPRVEISEAPLPMRLSARSAASD